MPGRVTNIYFFCWGEYGVFKRVTTRSGSHEKLRVYELHVHRASYRKGTRISLSIRHERSTRGIIFINLLNHNLLNKFNETHR